MYISNIGCNKFKYKFILLLATIFLSDFFVPNLKANEDFKIEYNDKIENINDKKEYINESYYIIGPGDLISVSFQNNEFLNLSYGNRYFRGIFMFEKTNKWIKCPQNPPFLNIDHGNRHFWGNLFFC